MRHSLLMKLHHSPFSSYLNCPSCTTNTNRTKQEPHSEILHSCRQAFGKSTMSPHKNNGKSPKLDLKLNLSLLPRGEPSTLMRMERDDDDDDNNNNSPNRMSTSSSGLSLTSPPSSCVSSENSPEASTSMVLAGCPRCLMYVMLPKNEEPKCPKCKNAVLLDFNHGKNKNKSNNGKF